MTYCPSQASASTTPPSRKWRNIVEPIYHTALRRRQWAGTRPRKRRVFKKKERGVAEVAVDCCQLKNIVGKDHVAFILVKEYDTRLLAERAVSAKGAHLAWVSVQTCPRFGNIWTPRSLRHAEWPRTRIGECAGRSGEGQCNDCFGTFGCGRFPGQLIDSSKEACAALKKWPQQFGWIFEARPSHKVEVGHRVIPWLVEHC